MGFKEFFKPSLNQLGTFFIILVINFLIVSKSCFGGSCYSVINLIENIIFFYLLSCIVVYLTNKIAIKNWFLRFLFFIISFWVLLIIVNIIIHAINFMYSPSFHLGYFLDRDFYEYSFGLATISTLIFLPFTILYGFIKWIIIKFKN
jgi:hypothetical protein